MPSNSVFSQILNKTFDIVDEITDSADDAMDRLDSRMDHLDDLLSLLDKKYPNKGYKVKNKKQGMMSIKEAMRSSQRDADALRTYSDPFAFKSTTITKTTKESNPKDSKPKSDSVAEMMKQSKAKMQKNREHQFIGIDYGEQQKLKQRERNRGLFFIGLAMVVGLSCLIALGMNS